MANSAQVSFSSLVRGYALCAKTEGKSQNSIDIVVNSMRYFESFLCSSNLSLDISRIGRGEIRLFTLFLQQQKRFSCHPFNHVQEENLSGYTINCYLRSIRAFFSWLVSEGVIAGNPFDRVKIPRPPKKIIPAFSQHQVQQLLATIDVSKTEGYRDYAVILTLLDTGLRISELCSLCLSDLWLEDGMLKVMGKGDKERLIPIGRQVQRVLWRYINRHRPEPAVPNCDSLFLTRDGRPLTKDRVEKIIGRYGNKAGLKGVRCSPHTLRHTAAITFLRNGGDVFSLQRMLGHSSLEMTRRYCDIADIDVKRAHMTASPVDNLGLGAKQRKISKQSQ